MGQAHQSKDVRRSLAWVRLAHLDSSSASLLMVVAWDSFSSREAAVTSADASRNNSRDTPLANWITAPVSSPRQRLPSQICQVLVGWQYRTLAPWSMAKRIPLPVSVSNGRSSNLAVGAPGGRASGGAWPFPLTRIVPYPLRAKAL